MIYIIYNGFGGVVVRMLASGTQVRGFKPGGSRRIFGRKILSISSLGGKVKRSVPCRRFSACKRSLNGVKKASFWQNYPTPLSPTVQLLRALALLGTWRHLAAEVGTSKGKGKQWQITPKNFPRMLRARAIPAVWRGSGFCAKTDPRAEY
jgi:hypothetical protein